MDLEHVDVRNCFGLEDEWGVYGIAGVSHGSKEMVDYFNYVGSARGCYSNRDHIGILARMNSHLDKLKLSHDEVIASRNLGAAGRPQYVHELCSRPNTDFRMFKLASLPIIFNAGVLQMQMKQMAVFIEQVYLVYFGNYSETVHTQAVINRL